MKTKIELKEHNESAVKELRKALKTSQKVCTVRATGTGKSYIIASLVEDYDRILIITPSIHIIKQQLNLIGEHKGIEYLTYQKAIQKKFKVPTKLNIIFLDEFHRMGAPVWGDGIKKIIDKNPGAKIVGLTATNIRGLEGRDMAKEMFNGKITSGLSLPEAWVEGILPLPRYVSALYEVDEIIEEEKRKAGLSKAPKEIKDKVLDDLEKIRVDWKYSHSIASIIFNYLPKKTKKIIVFTESIKELQRLEPIVEGWFRCAGFDPTIYSVHSDKSESKVRKILEKFRQDNKGLKVLLSVNMLNEGLHIPGVDSVMFLRKTQSNIVFLQQLGRCITSDQKSKPVVFDLVGNIDLVNVKDGILLLNQELDLIQDKKGIKKSERIALKIEGYLREMIDTLEKIRRFYLIDPMLEKARRIIESGDYSEVTVYNDIYKWSFSHRTGYEKSKCQKYEEADILWENRPNKDEKTTNYREMFKDIIKSGDYSSITPGSKLYSSVLGHKTGGKLDYWKEADVCWENRNIILNRSLRDQQKICIESGDYSNISQDKDTSLYSSVLLHRKGGRGEHWPEADICWKNRPQKREKGRELLKAIIKSGDYSSIASRSKIYELIQRHKLGSGKTHWPEADICWKNRPKVVEARKDGREILQKIIESGDYSSISEKNNYLLCRNHKKGGSKEYWPEADICWENRPNKKEGKK